MKIYHILKNLDATPYHWKAFVFCWLAGIFAGMNTHLFTLFLPHVVGDICITTDRQIISQIGSKIVFFFLMGWALGGIIFGIIGDRWGRKKAMVMAIIWFSLFTSLTSLAQTHQQLYLWRFLTGFGIGGGLICISTFLSETWPEKTRSYALGCLITCTPIGIFLAGLICQILPYWRSAFATAGISMILAVFIHKQLKETPAWSQIALRSKVNLKLMNVKEVFRSKLGRNLAVGSAIYGSMLIGNWASISWVPTWIQDLVGNDVQGDAKNYAIMYHSICAMCGAMISGFVVEKIGRLSTILGGLICVFLFSAWMFLSNDRFSSMIYMQFALVGCFLGLVQASLYIYLPELFPTHLRATSVGICLNSGRIITAVAVLFVGILVTLLGGYAQALIIMAGVYLVGAAACLFGKETKSLPAEPIVAYNCPINSK